MSEISFSSQRSTSTGVPGALTIGGLARAAGVGVETVRYYQRRRLLPGPSGAGGIGRYPASLIDRIRFMKKSQNLGFTIDGIRELLRLERGGKRKDIRSVAYSCLTSIRALRASARKSTPFDKWSRSCRSVRLRTRRCP